MVSHQNNTEAGRSDAWMLAAGWAHVLAGKGIGNSGNPQAGGLGSIIWDTKPPLHLDIKQHLAGNGPSLGSKTVPQTTNGQTSRRMGQALEARKPVG